MLMKRQRRDFFVMCGLKKKHMTILKRKHAGFASEIKIEHNKGNFLNHF